MKPLEDNDVTAVGRPDQAWHLARMEAFRTLADLCSTIPRPGSAESCEDPFHLIRDEANRLARQSWADFVGTVARSDRERLALLPLGAGTQVELPQNEGTPVIHWPEDSAVDLGPFGQILVPEDVAAGTFSYALTDPFLRIDVASLPAGTRHWRMTDTRHASTAAVVELARALQTDVERIADAGDSGKVWRTMIGHAHTLQIGAEASLTYLPHDHYRSWEPRLPKLMHLEQAPLFVDSHAATTTAQQRLALHYIAEYFRGLLTSIESKATRHDDRVRLVRDALRADYAGLARVYEDMNASRLRGEGLDPSEFSAFVAFRPRDYKHPVIIAVPIAAIGIVSGMAERSSPEK